jgi:hypothetical protein
MKPDDGKDSMFSSGKPKRIPWFFIPVLIGVAVLVLLYQWFR